MALVWSEGHAIFGNIIITDEYGRMYWTRVKFYSWLRNFMTEPWTLPRSLVDSRERTKKAKSPRPFKLGVIIMTSLISVLVLVFITNLLRGSKHEQVSQQIDYTRKVPSFPLEQGNVCTRGFNLRFLIPIPNDQVNLLMALMKQLQRINYHGCRIIIEFIKVGEISTKVANYLDQLDWPFGGIYTHSWQEEAQDEAPYASWHPLDHEFGIFFDTDLNVNIHRQLMTELLRLIDTYLVDGNVPRQNSLVDTKLFGISLQKLKRTPITTDSMLLNQKLFPGAMLFTPWSYKKFLHFAKWQKEQDGILNTTWKGDWRELVNNYLQSTASLILYPVRDSLIDTSRYLDQLKSLPLLYTIPIIDYNGIPRRVTEFEPISTNYIGFPLTKSSKRCILDEIGNPILTASPGRTRYMFYEPYGSVASQIAALQSALIFSNLLNRTLIIPPLLNPLNQSQWLPFGSVYAVDFDWLKIAAFETFQFFAHPIHRTVLYRPQTWSSNQVRSLPTSGKLTDIIIKGPTILLPVLNYTDEQLVSQYSGCQDDILTFSHFEQVLPHITLPIAQENLHRLRVGWQFRPQLRWYLERIGEERWPGPMACVMYSRGDENQQCGMAISTPFINSTQQALVEYRSCKASPLRTIEYAQEILEKTGWDVKGTASLYLMQDTSLSPTEFNALPTSIFSGTTILTATNIAHKMHLERTLSIPKESTLFVARLIERELCLNAAFFINNRYSSLGNLLVSVREVRGLPNAYLGQTDFTLPLTANSTLNSKDLL